MTAALLLMALAAARAQVVHTAMRAGFRIRPGTVDQVVGLAVAGGLCFALGVPAP